MLSLRVRVAPGPAAPDDVPPMQVAVLGSPCSPSVPRGTRPGIPKILGRHREAIPRAARRQGFTHVRVDGSVPRSEAIRGGDVGLLVDRSDGTSLPDRAAPAEELEVILGRRVDVVLEESLPWLARPQVLFEAASV